MNKTIHAVSSALVFAATSLVALPAVAQDKGPATDIVEFCDRFGNDTNGSGLPTAGSCVSYFRTGGAVGFCKQAKDFGVLALYGFTSQGECVVALSR